jgi:hypothetical protein
MLLLASTHTHHAEEVNTSCYACIHHLPHDGHISTSPFSIDHCVLCHFLALPYIAAATISVTYLVTVLCIHIFAFQKQIALRKQRFTSLRAPPYCL